MTETTSKKRTSDSLGLEGENSKLAKHDSCAVGTKTTTAKPKIANEYEGYSLQKDTRATTTIDVVDPSAISPAAFFDQYVRQRKPCVLNGLSPGKDNSDGRVSVSRQLLEDVAGDKTIQVEKRFSLEENFGQNRTSKRQVQLTIRDFLKKLLDCDGEDNSCKNKSNNNNNNNKSELYYWSTQEDTDDPYNVPCRQLLDQGHIPSSIPHAGNLILSSCNMWMGASKDGASSGLHHDYHDNFYLLLQGRKRFRLLSPDCAPALHVYGTIEHIFPNGRISYVGNETRADGVPLKELANAFEDNESDDDDDDDDEEEIVIGGGFDYVSDEEGNGADFDTSDNQNDDFDEIMGLNAGDAVAGQDLVASPSKDALDDDQPDSFSRINP
ncbi:MAG: hypothetical protein SGARI_005854, partial [Bacillariaceae sp.]